MSHRKRFNDVWACPACIAAVTSSVSTGPPEKEEEMAVAHHTTPATPSCQIGWVVTVKNSMYPEDSEHAFQLAHISCAPRPATSDDLHRGRTDLRVGQQIVDATVYVNVTDTMFELDSTAPRCLRAADICWTNVCHRTTSRQSRHTMHVVGKPRTYRRPPQHVYITQMMCDEINVTVE